MWADPELLLSSDWGSRNEQKVQKRPDWKELLLKMKTISWKKSKKGSDWSRISQTVCSEHAEGRVQTARTGTQNLVVFQVPEPHQKLKINLYSRYISTSVFTVILLNYRHTQWDGDIMWQDARCWLVQLSDFMQKQKMKEGNLQTLWRRPAAFILL